MSRKPSRRARPRRRTLRPPVIPRPEQLQELYAELQSLPNVEGCYIGFKRRDGRTLRGEVSIVACVSEKPGTRAIPKDARVPKRLGWRLTSRRNGSIPTDVQVLGSSAMHAAVLGAGDGIDHVGSHPADGTVGAAMDHPIYGKVVTTAGHVLGLRTFSTITYPVGAEPRVVLRNGGNGEVMTGIARKASITRDADYAIISPPPGVPAENLYRDQHPLAAPYAPGPADLGKPVYILARPQIFRALLLGVHGTLSIEGVVLRDLLLTELKTNGGDSGACLVNHDSRLLGFVEGETSLDGEPVTIYTAAAWPFVREHGVFF